MNKLFLNLIGIALITIILTGCDGPITRSKSYLCMTDSDSISVVKMFRVSYYQNDDYMFVNNYIVTPDEENIIVNCGSNGIWRVDKNGDDETLLSDTLWVRSTELSLSDDRSVIAFVARGDIYRVKVDGSDLTKLTDTANDYEDYPCFYGVDNQILFTSINNINEIQQYHTVSTMNFDGTERENLIMENSRAAVRFSYPAYLPQGDKVVYLLHGDDSGVDCLNKSDGSLTRFLNGDMRDNRISLSDDGSRFAVTSLASSIVFSSTGDIIHQDSYGYSNQNTVISPSGNKVVLSDDTDSTILNLDTDIERRISGTQPFWVGNNIYYISRFYNY